MNYLSRHQKLLKISVVMLLALLLGGLVSLGLAYAPAIAQGGSSGVDGSLVVTDTVSFDVERYALTQAILAGSQVITLSASPQVITANSEILIVKMAGPNVGAFETAIVDVVTNNTVSLVNPLTNNYNISDKTVVQYIPNYTSVTVESGGSLIAPSWNGSAGGIIFLRSLTLTVKSGGQINANSSGYRGGGGQGEGPGGGYGAGWSYTDGGGGGYGGNGGRSTATLGLAYGSVYTPTCLGSAGGNGGPAAWTPKTDGGSGGGTIYLLVSDTLTLEGNLTTNGVNVQYRAGAGAGGTIFIKTRVLSGSGTIAANGGLANTGGGGAGGRIALYYEIDEFSPGLVVEARGGTGGKAGDPGTIYLNHVDPITSTIEIGPTSIPANGVAMGTITVTLRTITGTALSDEPVAVAVKSGNNTYINGQPATAGVKINLAPTDGNGVSTATITSTTAETKVFEAYSGWVRLIDPATVVFDSDYVDPASSTVSVEPPTTVAADGSAVVEVTVTARDRFGNLVPGISTGLATQPTVTVIPVYSVTNGQGQALYHLSHDQPAQVVITATVDEQIVSQTATATFKGSDLAITKTGTDEIAAGYLLTYTITLVNQGLLTATNVVITDSLPAEAGFVLENSSYSFTRDGSELRWEVGDLARQQSVDPIQVSVSVPVTVSLVLTNRVTAGSDSVELQTANNTDTVLTTVEAAVPVLMVSPLYPTLAVSPGMTNTLVVMVRNDGLGVMTNTQVILPATLPAWVSVSPTNLGDILPGQAAPVTILADAREITQLGHYRDRLMVQAAGQPDKYVYLDVHVQGPQRDLQLTLTNNTGAAVEDGWVVLTEQIMVVTEGSTAYEPYYRQGVTNEAGQLTFPTLEAGKAYQFNIEADHHQSRSGSITVTVGSGVQPWPVVLDGLPSLTVSPSRLVFGAARGGLAQRELVLYNPGALTLTNIVLTPPAALPWVYLGQPPADAVIPPGGQLAVTVNAAPTAAETWDRYEGSLQINADGGNSATVPLEISVNDGLNRTLCLSITTKTGGPLNDGTVRLSDQTGQEVMRSDGITETVQNVVVQRTDSAGRACFADLTPGPYEASVGRGEQLLGKQSFSVSPGEGNQEETMEVDDPSLVVNWSVVPTTIVDEYTTVITMTFIPEAPPRLSMWPRSLSLCDPNNPGSDGIISQTVTIHNFYPVTFTNATLELEAIGNVRATITTTTGSSISGFPNGTVTLGLGTIGPNEDVQLALHAQLAMDPVPQCMAGDAGGIMLKVSANYEHYASNHGWYGLNVGDITGGDGSGGPIGDGGNPGQGGVGGLDLGQVYTIPLKLINTGYPANSNLHTTAPDIENIHLTPPQQLSWMSLSATDILSIPLQSEVNFNLVVDPPEWLAFGTYYDHILITGTNSITALISIEAEMSETGLRIETQLVTPLKADAGGGIVQAAGRPAGLAYPLSYLPLGQGGGSLQAAWQNLINTYNTQIFEPVDLYADAWAIQVYHCTCTSGGPQAPAQPSWQRIGNQLIATRVGPGPGLGGGVAFAPEFKDNVVQLVLSQNFSLERQAFIASMELINGLDRPLTNLDVDILITDAGSGALIPLRAPGQPITPTSAITPVLPAQSVIPTDTTFLNIPEAWQQSAPVNFTIIPTTTVINDLGAAGSGADRQLYTWTLVPDAFGVTEAAGHRLGVQAVIRYQDGGATRTVTTTRQIITVLPQPKVLLDYFIPSYVLGGQTFDWIVVATNIGYGAARNFKIDTPQPRIIKQSEQYPTDFTLLGPSTLALGDLEPGEQAVQAWRILPSRSGSFVDWQAVCIHHDYQGVELPALVYCQPNIHFYDPPPTQAQQWAKEDACMIGSYQAFDSDPINTYSGNFSYSRMDVSIPTWGEPLEFERSYNSQDEEDGPLGPGWTHNYNLALKRETFIGWNGESFSGIQDVMSVRLPRGSRAYFEVEDDGDTFTPFPGVRAELVRSGDVYTLTQPGTQLAYIFNAAQKLAAIQDANGNRLELTYSDEITSSARRLLRVTGPAGRSLVFDYDDTGHIVQMTDPLSRTYSYTYTAGYLTGATDFRGYTTVFTYTQPDEEGPGQLISMTDPEGHVVVTNHYDSERRVDWQEDAGHYRTTFTYTVQSDSARMTTLTDPRGNRTIDVYDADGRLVERRDSYGFLEKYEYDADYNLVELTDKKGRVTQYDWNDCGCDYEVVTDPLLHTTRMTFDDRDQVTSVTDERNYVTTITYDDRTNPLTITNPLTGTRSFTYGPHGELLSRTDENDHTTYYGYDIYGHTTVITDAKGGTTRMTYDLAGRLLSTTDALGRVTTYSYDPGDNLLTAVDPLTGTTTFTYDRVGNRLSMADALERTTSYSYDARNNLVQVTNAAGDSQAFDYDANGNLVSETNENDQITTYQYDGLNRLLRVTNALSGTASYTYDPVGNRLTERDANDNLTRYVYDANDRVIETIYPDQSRMAAVYDPADNLLSLTDGEDRTISYQYDALGRVTVLTDPISGTVIYSYDAVGNQVTVTDAEGRTTKYDYDSLNRLIRVTDPLSGTTHVVYDAVGNRTGLTDAGGRAAAFSYDELNRLVKATDPMSGAVQYGYDAVGNKAWETDPLGRVTTFAYDDLNRLISLTNALSGTATYGYDPAGNLLWVTDAEQRTTHYTYDDLNRLVAATDPLSGTTSFAYDANGNLIQQTDAEGRTTTYTYDAFNQRLNVTDPFSGTLVYGYDSVGNLARLTDANNRVTEYTYDGLDRVIAVRDALLNTTTYNYDGVGNLLARTDAEGHTARFAYDGLDRLIEARDAVSNTVTYDYDAVGNLLAQTDAEGRTATFVYDDLDRPTVVTNALSQTITYTYDAAGNQLSLADARGQTTSYAYDGLNRLISATDPLSQTTVFTYSLAGNLTASTNPLGQTTRYDYDALDRLTKVTDALNQETRYNYDRVGNQLSQTDAANRTATFSYDALNRLVRATNALSGVTSYDYDAVGNLTRVTDPRTHTIEYEYDALNRLARVTDPLEHLTEFKYDKVGNQVELIDPRLRSTVYRYDAAYRLVEIEDPAHNLTTFSYDKAGNVLAATDAEGRTTTTMYDALNRPLEITNPLSGTTQFTYDEAGNQAGIRDAEGRWTTFTYDELNRLVRATNALSGATTFEYDALGNQTAVIDAGQRRTGYTYDDLNRLVTVTDPRGGTTTYGYDPAGNVLLQVDPLGKVITTTYDALNRPIEMVDALGGRTRFAYDGNGNLVSVTDANDHTTTYAYDPLNRLLAVSNPLSQSVQYEYDEVGNNTAVIDPLNRRTEFGYDNLDRLVSVTDPLQRVTGYAYDKVGNRVGMTDAENVATRYEYDALNRLTAVVENYVDGGPQNADTNVRTGFDYDRVGNMTGMADPRSHTTSLGYDALNRLVSRRNPLDHLTSYDYDAVGNLTQLVDANNQTTRYAYDALNRLTTITRPDETVGFTYDAAGNRLTMTDGTGATGYTYDDLYRLTGVTDPQEQTVQYAYDAVGNRTGLAYPDQSLLTYSYDPANRLISVADWDSGLTEYSYDAAGQVTEVVLPNGITSTYSYDDAGQLTLLQHQNLTGTLASYAYGYDNVGNRTQAVEMVLTSLFTPTAVFTATPLAGLAPLNVTFYNASTYATGFAWDFGDGYTETIASPLSGGIEGGLTTTHVYSTPGIYSVSLVAYNDHFSHTLTRTHYIAAIPPDAFQEENGLVAIEAENFAARIAGASHDWLTRTGQPGYTGTSYLQVLPDLDALSRTGEITASARAGYVVNFSTTLTDSGQLPVTYTVWLRGFPTNAAGDSVYIGLGEQMVEMTGFAPNGWSWTNIASAGGPAALLVDTPGFYTLTLYMREDGLRLDRLLLTTDTTYIATGDGPAESPRASAGSYAFAAPASTTETALARAGSGQDRVAGKLAAVRHASQPFAHSSFAHSPFAHDPTLLFLPPLAAAAPLARRRRWRRGAWLLALILLALALLGAGTALAADWHSGALLPANGPASIAATPSPAPARAVYNGSSAQAPVTTTDTLTTTYTYDPLYRLTGANGSDGSTFGYSYDAAGNRLAYTIDGSQVATYTYDIANRLAQVNDRAYSYDNNGNLLDDGLFSYTYDSANRLARVVTGTFTTEYAYNGDGVRVAQIQDGLRTDYVQDVASPLPQVLTARQGGTVAKYLAGLGLIGEQTGGTGPNAGPAAWQYYVPDALGSVRQVTDPAGQVMLTRRYDPFGGLQTSAGIARSTYGFAGEEQDPTSGQLFLRARTYDPGTGRFLQADPVPGLPNQPRTLQKYAYAFSNPVNFTDPSGQMPPGVIGAPLMSIPGYTPSPFNGPSYAPVPETQFGPGYLPPSTGSDRSANTAAWSPYSDPYARQHSQGFQPRPCGIGDVLHGLWGNPQGGGLLPELLEFGLHGARNNKSWVTDAGSWLNYTATANLAQLNWWLSNPYNLQVTLGALVIGGAVIFTGGAAIPAIILGAGIGAGISAGVQVWDNYWQQAPALFDINWRGVAWGAFHGAVAAAGAELIAPLLPGGGVGLMGAAQIGFSEFVAGRASQVALNLATGQAWNKDFWNLQDIALDIIPGVSAGPLVRGAGKAFGGAAGLVGQATRGSVRAARGAVDLAGRVNKEGTRVFNSTIDVAGRATKRAFNSLLDRVGRNIDEATNVRLRNLDVFTGGNYSRLRDDELRRVLTKNIGNGTLIKRLRAFRDKTQVEKIYGMVKETKAGANLLQETEMLESEVKVLGSQSLSIKFNPSLRLDEEVQHLGEYEGESAHTLLLNPTFRDLPIELAAPTLAHELTHRTYSRWEYQSMEDEILAHRIGAQVWQELKQRPDLPERIVNLPGELKKQAELVIKMHNETLEAALTKSDEGLGEWLRGRSESYAGLPYHRLSVFAPPEGVSPSKTVYDVIEFRLRLRKRYGP